MQELPYGTTINTLFDEPKPLDQFIEEMLAVLEITQKDLSDATGLTQGSISRIINRKTTTPSVHTLEKIRHTLIEQYGASPQLSTMDFLLACRALIEPRPADTVDSRFAEFDAWLNSQPDTVQENFWDMLNIFKRTVDSAGKA